jgi:[acyl-carrier-protein] S-malonyltransferase
VNKKIAFVFPGQGSQSVGMLDELAAEYPVVRDTFAEGSDAVGRDLWYLVSLGPKEVLDRTENTQPAMLAAGVAVWRVWVASGGPEPQWMAGHSLGEFSALVCAGAVDFGDAVRLVAHRSQFMQEAVPGDSGAMAAVLGLSDDAVRELCAKAAEGNVLEAVNFNSPGQVVIAGHLEAVNRAVAAAKIAGAKRALRLSVSVPSHCALMRPAADKLAVELDRIEIRAPKVDVLHNVSVGRAWKPGDIRELLVRQLYSPVRWAEIIQQLAAEGATAIVESGPGKVLTGLTKRIDKRLGAFAASDPKALATALEEIGHA